MKKAIRLAAAGGLALAAAVIAPAASQAATRPAGHPAGHAGEVFVQTDALSGNAVVVYDRAADGTLRQAGTYPTGGEGGRLTGSVADHLASQGSLSYDKTNG